MIGLGAAKCQNGIKLLFCSSGGRFYFANGFYRMRHISPFSKQPWKRSWSRTFTAQANPCVPQRGPTWKQTGKGNVFLMGSPGSGKTSLARIVSSKLGIPYFDVDDDLLEKEWKMPVAEKLKRVGGERFVKEEGEALMQLQVENSVVSLSGSNPMHRQAMQHIQELGVVVYLDVKNSDILKRLDEMKVDRIVGQENGIPMSDILEYRQQFYENCYDIRIICREGESLDSIADKIAVALSSFDDNTDLVSTRGSDSCGFNEAILRGLAADGGLFVPDYFLPRLENNAFARLVPLSYVERAVRILEFLIPSQVVHPSYLRRCISMAFAESKFGSNVCRVVPTPDKPRSESILELFHGPTGSFKDLALQLMPYIFHHAARSQQSKATHYLILVATSGDTGSAVAEGFRSFTGDGSTKVLVLFPENGVSSVQKLQMLSAQNENVHVVGVDGDFDFCQNAIKSILNDQRFPAQLYNDYNVRLSAANSINWARLIAQTVYHISGYLDLVGQNIIHMGQEIDIAVPTGNFGNILSAVYAKNMGLPIRKLICASNGNNILTEFINTGSFNLAGRRLLQTSSPAIDILVSSNLERYIYEASNGNSEEVCHLYRELQETGRFRASSLVMAAMQSDFWADWCMESSCFDFIHDYYNKTGYLLDPHTAVAMVVSKKFDRIRGPVPLMVCATAHYAKFPSAVLQAVKKTPIISESPSELLKNLKELNPKPSSHKGIMDAINSSKGSHVVLRPDLMSVSSHIKSIL